MSYVNQSDSIKKSHRLELLVIFPYSIMRIACIYFYLCKTVHYFRLVMSVIPCSPSISAKNFVEYCSMLWNRGCASTENPMYISALFHYHRNHDSCKHSKKHTLSARSCKECYRGWFLPSSRKSSNVRKFKDETIIEMSKMVVECVYLCVDVCVFHLDNISLSKRRRLLTFGLLS